MSDDPYTKRELDRIFQEITAGLSRIEAKNDEANSLILAQTTKTNGRVTRLEIAAIIAFAMLAGYGIREGAPFLLKLLI